MKTLSITFGITFFAVAIISASALTDASALIDDGTLTKYSPNGHYKVDMSWEPAGEIVPGQNYDFTFTISNSLTEKRLQVSNFDLGVVQNDVLVTDRSINAAGTVKEEFLFLQAGITHILNVTHNPHILNDTQHLNDTYTHTQLTNTLILNDTHLINTLILNDSNNHTFIQS